MEQILALTGGRDACVWASRSRADHLPEYVSVIALVPLCTRNRLRSVRSFRYSLTACMTSGKTIDLNRLCVLARLSLTGQEKEKLGPQLARIVGYVEELREVDVDGVEPMAHAIPLENVLREDVAVAPPDSADLLRNAPAARANQVVVPPVIEG